MSAATRRLHTIALGCQMSAADAAEASEPLLARGLSFAATPEEADVVLVSTCTVRQQAEDKALSLIGRLRRWRQASPERLLIVTGCAAERLQDQLRRRFPWVDLVVGALAIERLPGLLEEALAGRFDARGEDAAAFPETPSPWTGTGSSARAYVTIMRGCNYSCSYCIVPSVRGRELYRPPEVIEEEARRRLAAGAREIILLGQTVNSWRADPQGRGLRFADLLRRLDVLPGLRRLRFMSPHPYYVDESMLRAMAECRAVCPQLHLPAQSGSDRVLRLMRRNYSAAGLLETAARARASLPRVVFSTDIIVGFPSETEEDFEATLRLVARLEPAWAYTFKYSPRHGTDAASRPDDVPRRVKEQRLARLNALVSELSRRALERQVGRVAELLGESPGHGRTREGFRVRCGSLRTGEVAEARITSVEGRSLRGEIIRSEH